ncbi:barren [Hesseltinella vesiculosa]|uniref:Condensin complex subunit 2 n=1 Tax=Hesseltinella vesiculosa TaxID=101127 RepID=A0A1X2GF91_9FUNG|nr:barren [Hesseltinella vesiculosa]
MVQSTLQRPSFRNNNRKRSRQDRRSDNSMVHRDLLSRQPISNNSEPIQVDNVLPTVSPEQMYSNFEEWLKMATDNKINAANSWNFALIDYFHEMTFIRDGDTINFQRASCTLDGCVKIYTSRVDSVASETGKLLTGLADHGNANDDGEQEAEKRTRRKGNRSEKTLLKDFSSLAVKKLDVDFSVDPLFKKTSADFDEGGARGLLLNVLSLDQDGKIIFDSSDARPEQVDDDDQQLAIPIDAVAEPPNNSPSADDMDIDSATTPPIDEMELGSQLILFDDPGQHALTHESIMDITNLRAKLRMDDDFDKLVVCPTLMNIDFFKDGNDIMDELNEVSKEKDPDEQEPENPIVDEDYDYGFDAFDFQEDEQANDHDQGFADPFADVLDDTQPDQDHEPLQLEPDEPQDNPFSIMSSQQETDLLSYFDTTLSKTWAGPEHWKLRRARRDIEKPEPSSTQDNTSVAETESPGGPGDAPEHTNKKKLQVDTAIDFLNGEEVREEDIFGKNKRTNITLTQQQMTRDPATLLLPDDQHFSSKQLLRYFLKPKITLLRPKKFLRSRQSDLDDLPDPIQTNEPEEPSTLDNPDADFWADDLDYNEPPLDTTEPDHIEMDSTPFDEMSSMYPDTMYDDDTQDLYDSQVYDDPLVGSQVKKVKPPFMDYAKKAKRVDVKKLKENLWKALTLPPPEQAQEQVTAVVHGELKFTEVIHNLKKMYPVKVMRDISVPFCFICLLHLANEKNLSITGMNQGDDDDDFVLGDDMAWLNSDELLNEIKIVQNT